MAEKMSVTEGLGILLMAIGVTWVLGSLLFGDGLEQLAKLIPIGAAVGGLGATLYFGSRKKA